MDGKKRRVNPRGATDRYDLAIFGPSPLGAHVYCWPTITPERCRDDYPPLISATLSPLSSTPVSRVSSIVIAVRSRVHLNKHRRRIKGANLRHSQYFV